MKSEKVQYHLRVLLIAVLLAAILFVLYKYLIPLLLPFLFSLLISAIVLPAVGFLHRKLHLHKKLTAAILVTVTYLIVAGLLLLAGRWLYHSASNAVDWFNTRFVPDVNALLEKIDALMHGNDSTLMTWLYSMKDSLIATLQPKVVALSTAVVTDLVKNVPGFVVKVIISIVATYFFALDYDNIRRAVTSRMSESLYEKSSAAFRSLRQTIGQYLRAYSLIFLITFAELLVGLLCAGVKHFALIALGIAVFDILPILGSSMIMLPWSIITLLRGNYQQGIILFVVYLVIVIARQFIEPKIVGERVGLHPLITLLAMYVGLKLFGGLGLFTLPITCAVLMQLELAGVTHLFPVRREPTDPPPYRRPKRPLWKKPKKTAD